MSARAVLVLGVGALTLLGSTLAGCGTDDADGPSVAPADAAYCDAFGAIIAGPLNEAGSDFRDPEVLRLAVEITEELLRQMVAGAPEPVAADALAFATEYEGGFAVWERYGYNLTRVDAEATPEETAILDAFLAEPVGPGAEDPLDVLEAYYFERCTADVTLPPDPLSTTTSP